MFTGAYAINPVNDEKIPIYIADYVLMGYGTGAIMAVPAHDERDWEFAKKFDLPIKPRRETGERRCATPSAAFTDEGIAINSPHHRRPADRSRPRSTSPTVLDADGVAHKSVKYKLRDWLFSRQRYWGEPFPIVLDEDGDAYALDEDELPLKLPEMEDFKPTGTPEPPLSKATEWLKYRKPTDCNPWSYARDQHHAAVGGVVLVLPALLRSEEQGTLRRPGEGEILDAGRSVRRRRRARGAASALLAVLAQGAVRPGPCLHARAVHAAGEPGIDPRRDGVSRVRDRRWQAGQPSASCATSTKKRPSKA